MATGLLNVFIDQIQKFECVRSQFFDSRKEHHESHIDEINTNEHACALADRRIFTTEQQRIKSVYCFDKVPNHRDVNNHTNIRKNSKQYRQCPCKPPLVVVLDN